MDEREQRRAADAESGDLVRYWFEFDLDGLGPPRKPGEVWLDGGTRAHRLLWRGLGVTGYDERDCLALIESALGDEPLPLVVRVVRDVDVDALGLDAQLVGMPVWRGIWYPRNNLDGPTLP